MTPAAPHWASRAGPWVGIGASPAAFVLGAQLADDHGGALPAPVLVLGGAAMALVLVWQGRLGLLAPKGEGATFGAIAARYFTERTAAAVAGMLALSMIGWIGFNTGLGGGALAELTGIPPVPAAIAVGGVAAAVAAAGLRWWNWLAILATVTSLALTLVVVGSLEGARSPLTLAAPAPDRLPTDLAAFVGYVAVFGLRAPDFTAGLSRTRDVVWPALLLIVITFAVTAAGIAVRASTGTADVIEVISGRLAAGNALLVVAVLPATLTALHSGSLALRAAVGLRPATAGAVVAGAGLVLGVARFDRHLLLWLATLSALLVPVLVPLGVEVWRRRRGWSPRTVRAWSWLPGSVVGVAGVAAGWRLALPAALVTAGLGAVLESHSTGERRRPLQPQRYET